MCRFLRSLGIGRELGCMVPWKEVQDVFFARFLECRERYDKLAAGGRREPPVWLWNTFSSGIGIAA